MNPNQPPNYPVGNPNQPPNYPGGNPNQPPNYPVGNPNQPPNFPPGPYGHYPMYQTAIPMAYIQPSPQYPQPGTAGGPPVTPYMGMPIYSVKQEPMWAQENRYGMQPGPSIMPGMPASTSNPNPYGYPPMPGMPIDNTVFFSGVPDPSMYVPSPAAHAHSASSLLAQHLQSAPLPPPHLATQGASSHLSQLLQQPVYPPGNTSGFSGRPDMMQRRRDAEEEAMKMQAQQREVAQREYQLQQAAQARQEFILQQQQTRAAQLQAEQAAAAVNAAPLPAPPSVIPGFPPSASSSHSAYSAQQRTQEAQQMMPSSVFRDSPEKEANLERFNNAELCMYGRDLVSDLNTKTSALSLMLKKVMERKPLNQGENPNALAEQCRNNLAKMSEIREIIERRREPTWKRLTGDDYIELMLDDSELSTPMDEKQEMKRAELELRFPNILSKTPPNEGDVWYQGRWIPEALHRKYMKFEANKKTLKDLSSQLKALAWKIDVTSPGHLKKVDQTKISKKKPEEQS